MARGLAAAIDYLTPIGLDRVAAYEHELLVYATEALSHVPGLRLTGTAPHKAGILSFVLDGMHPHDIGTIFDRDAWPSVLAIIAASRSWRVWACPRRRGRPWRSTTRATRSTRW
jgi:hypothetical protein